MPESEKQPEKHWFLKQQGSESVLGPFKDADLLALAKHGRLNANSLVKSDKATKGQWVSVLRIAKIAEVMPKSTTPQPIESKQNLFDDEDFKLKPVESPTPPAPPPLPSLNELGLEQAAPPDPFGKAFDNYVPPVEPTTTTMARQGGSERIALPRSRRYIGLSFVRYALLILAAMEVLFWIGSSVVMLIVVFSAKKEQQPAIASFGSTYMMLTLFGAAVLCCLLIAASELIKLAMDVQENTLATAHAAQENQ